MRDILRLMLGDRPGEDGAEAEIWDGRRSRRPSVAGARDWCGTEPDDEAIRQLGRALRGGRGRGRPGRAGGRNRGLGPF